MKILILVLFVFLLGVSVTALTYDKPLRTKLFTGFNKSDPVVAVNSLCQKHNVGVRVKLPTR